MDLVRMTGQTYGVGALVPTKMLSLCESPYAMGTLQVHRR